MAGADPRSGACSIACGCRLAWARRKGVSVLDLAPPKGESRRRARLAVKSSSRKRRVCLRCDRKFDSAWAGNRICGGCAALPEGGGVRRPVVVSAELAERRR